MSACCERQKFTGAARWLRIQSQEENMHAMKLFDFVLARDAKVELKAIESRARIQVPRRRLRERARAGAGSQPSDYSLYETAFTEKAFAAVAELQWFLTEQVEEEKTGREIVAKFKMIGNDAASMLDMDRSRRTTGGGG